MATTLHFPTPYTATTYIVRQWCMPVLPSSSLPVVRASGALCQVHGNTRNAAGHWTSVYCARQLVGATTEFDITVTGQGIGGEAVPSLPSWVDDLVLQITPENVGGAVFEARFNDAPQGDPTKTGEYILQQRYWSRFNEVGGSRSLGGLKTYASVTSAAPQVVFLDFSFIFGAVDVATLATDGPLVAFNDLRIEGLGTKVISCAHPRHFNDWGNRYAIKPLGGTERHKVPVGQKITFRIAVTLNQSLELAYANALLNKSDSWGYTTGDNSFNVMPFGEVATPIIIPGSGFTYNPIGPASTVTGVEAMDAYFKDKLQWAKDTVLTGVEQPAFNWSNHGPDPNGPNPNGSMSEATGWMFPPGWLDGNQSGGGWKHFFSNYSNRPAEWSFCEIFGDQQQHRQRATKVRRDTGETLTVHDIAALNTVTPGELTHSCAMGAYDKRYRQEIPAIQPIDTTITSSPDPLDLPTNDYTEPWNTLETGNTCPYEESVEWWKNALYVNFSNWNDAHSARILGAPRTLIWCCADEVSKDSIANQSAWVEFCMSPVPVNRPRGGMAAASPQIQGGRFADLQANLAWVQANPGKPGRSIHRKEGQMINSMCLEYPSAPDARRTQLLATFKLLQDCWSAELPANKIANVYNESLDQFLKGPEQPPGPYTNDLTGLMYITQVFTYHEGISSALLIAEVAFQDFDPAYTLQAVSWGDAVLRQVHEMYGPNEVIADTPSYMHGAWRISGSSDNWAVDRPYYPLGCLVIDGGEYYECLEQHEPSLANQPTAGGQTVWAVTTKRDREMIAVSQSPYDTRWNYVHELKTNRYEAGRALASMYRLTDDPWYLERAAQQNMWGFGFGGGVDWSTILTTLWPTIDNQFNQTLGWNESNLQFVYSALYELDNYSVEMQQLINCTATAFDVTLLVVGGTTTLNVDLASPTSTAYDARIREVAPSSSTLSVDLASPTSAAFDVTILTFVTAPAGLDVDAALPTSSAFDISIREIEPIVATVDLTSPTSTAFDAALAEVSTSVDVLTVDLASPTSSAFDISTSSGFIATTDLAIANALIFSHVVDLGGLSPDARPDNRGDLQLNIRRGPA